MEEVACHGFATPDPLDDVEAPSPLRSRRSMLQAAAGSAIGIVLSGSEAAATPIKAAQSDLLLPPATQALAPFRISIPQAAIVDLKQRIARARLPEPETVADWSQGVPVARLRALVGYWQDRYDWRRFESRANTVPQFRTAIDGLGIHFAHIRSKHAQATPIVLTHGWPGSFIEFLKIVDPLTNPTAHGGSARDAFHVVIPSLPGFGFSDKPTAAGWGLPRIARAWATLMGRLGYDRYVAQGGDWGAGVATWMAKQRVRGLAGLHLNLPILFPPPIVGQPSAVEQATIARLVAFDAGGAGYSKIQGTRPQTLGYALADSPIGQAAWIYEKFAAWTDSKMHPENVLTHDEMLDNITLYWLTDTAASSARLYWESFKTDFVAQKLDIPVAVSLFPGELYHPPRIWGERTYSKLVYWNDTSRGGHFAAFEQPEIFVEELRRARKQLL